MMSSESMQSTRKLHALTYQLGTTLQWCYDVGLSKEQMTVVRTLARCSETLKRFFRPSLPSSWNSGSKFPTSRTILPNLP